ncbi:unnamed protein product [Ilex paraguariensis]|uniref:F-box domain-containing protein n=1 Tax=Ilex paraguariensis TaxID=185542 RepID=A0ABC8R6W5_9AQUA
MEVAVQTCLLSKRWRYLWTSLPYLDFDDSNLDFDDSNFPFSFEIVSDWCLYYEYKMRCFMNFVTHFLSLREDSTVCTFRLSASEHFFVRRSLADKCVNYAISHNVQEFDINNENKYNNEMTMMVGERWRWMMVVSINGGWRWWCGWGDADDGGGLMATAVVVVVG